MMRVELLSQDFDRRGHRDSKWPKISSARRPRVKTIESVLGKCGRYCIRSGYFQPRCYRPEAAGEPRQSICSYLLLSGR